MKKLTLIATPIVIILLIMAFIEGVQLSSRADTRFYKPLLATKIDYKIPQELIDAAAPIGLTDQQLINVHAQIGAEPNSCLSVAQSCYDPNSDTVRVYVAAFTDGQATESLAYEYYHHVWQKVLSEQQRQALIPQLQGLYAQLAPTHPILVQEVSILVSGEGALGSPAINDELNSLACTKVQDSQLPLDILHYCNTYVPHREVLPRPY